MQQEDPGFEKDCETCPNNLETIDDEAAIEIIYLFGVLSGQLRTAGMSGYPLALDYGCVQFIFDVYEVPEDVRKFYFEWITRLTNELIIQPMREELNEGNRDKTIR